MAHLFGGHWARRCFKHIESIDSDIKTESRGPKADGLGGQIGVCC